MKLTIAQLRAAGVSDKQILDALAEADAEQRERNRQQSKIRSQNYRNRVTQITQKTRDAKKTEQDQCTVTEITRDVRDVREGVSPLPSTAATSTVVQEERSEIVALGREWAQFYSRYPHKVAPRKARVAFERARKRAAFDVIMAGLERYANKTDDRPWANPATWLNGDRWEDQPGPAQEGNGHGRAGGRPAPKDDPKSIRGAFDRIFERIENGDIPRETNLRVIPGRSG